MKRVYRVSRFADKDRVSDNVLNHNISDFPEASLHLRVNGTDDGHQPNGVVYRSVASWKIAPGSIGMNVFVRNHMNLSFSDDVRAEPFIVDQNRELSTVDIRIRLHRTRDGNSQTPSVVNVHEEELKDDIRTQFSFVLQYVHHDQCLYLITKEHKFIITINSLEHGFVGDKTVLNISSDDEYLNIVGSNLLKRDLFRDDYNFEDIGIGGLDKELVNVFRRCLSTRSYKPSLIQKMGIHHVKGMLLYGPPGTGKTLIARRIGNMISNIPPKVVNGPEIMNKFVGESERNIRELFSDAISDTSNANLHVIIFDEIDAICKTRGRNTSGTGVNDSIVNQLLTMIEGFKPLENIFIIAMTNRKDLLDEALLRAGRLEVHIEIGLPDSSGREQIFRIHTGGLSASMLDRNVNIKELADLTENYSGAEIKAVVGNAAARALHDGILSNSKEDEIMITREHFVAAIEEVIPSFGSIRDRTVLLPLKPRQQDCFNNIRECLDPNSHCETILVTGEPKSGKTTLVTKIAIEAKAKFTKIISALDLISMDEIGKANHISDIVKNAYISTTSLVVIDDIEIALNFAKVGNNTTFSNRLYQVMATILKTEPSSSQIIILCTCTNVQLSLDIETLFRHSFTLTTDEPIN